MPRAFPRARCVGGQLGATGFAGGQIGGFNGLGGGQALGLGGGASAPRCWRWAAGPLGVGGGRGLGGFNGLGGNLGFGGGIGGFQGAQATSLMGSMRLWQTQSGKAIGLPLPIEGLTDISRAPFLKTVVCCFWPAM